MIIGFNGTHICTCIKFFSVTCISYTHFTFIELSLFNPSKRTGLHNKNNIPEWILRRKTNPNIIILLSGQFVRSVIKKGPGFAIKQFP